MSYRAMPPIQDYVIIADETTLIYANDELRDHARVLVPAADRGSLDTMAFDRQNTDFFTSSSPETSPSLLAWCAPRWPPCKLPRTSSTGWRLSWAAHKHLRSWEEPIVSQTVNARMAAGTLRCRQ